MTMLGESRASAERVFEILDARSEVEDEPGATELGSVNGEVVFDRVTFSYIGRSRVLSDISFRVEAGQVVALLGPTGSGKSTIINLIPRFYDVTSGAIKIDDIPVRSVTLESLRRQIGIVLQETMLFGSTIRENIAFGRPEASEEEIEAAAEAAAAHEFIMSIPDGYDTEVGERGVTLSGGQRQRIAIARALIRNPRILILDEATSSLDTVSESKVQEALSYLMKDRTTFVIAHRLSTIKNADKIVVLKEGRVEQIGKHDELIEQEGAYRELYDPKWAKEQQRQRDEKIEQLAQVA